MVNKQEFLDTYSYFDKEVLIEIIDIFISEHKGKIEKLYESINASNFQDLRFDAHSIKGAIASFNAPVAWEKARNMEKTASYYLENGGEGYSKESMVSLMNELRDCVYEMVTDLGEIKDGLLQAT